jgi:ADP-ribose pyrophosphatase YjhB (NUDIX family)
MDYIKYIRSRVGNDLINLTGVNVLIINSKNEVLLQKRGEYPFKWGLIGGITELGESLRDTAIREAFEETGLTIRDLVLLDTSSGKDCHLKLPNGDQAYFITIGFYTTTYEGEFLVDHKETLDLKFYGYDSLPKEIPVTHRGLINKYYDLD